MFSFIHSFNGQRYIQSNRTERNKAPSELGEAFKGSYWIWACFAQSGNSNNWRHYCIYNITRVIWFLQITCFLCISWVSAQHILKSSLYLQK